MDVDFSTVNLQYLLRARDCAREDTQRSAALLQVPPELVQLLAESEPELFAAFPRIAEPLLAPKGEPWWWKRLFEAVRSGRQGELEAVLEHMVTQRLSRELSR